jgi:hypothetical protein
VLPVLQKDTELNLGGVESFLRDERHGAEGRRPSAEGADTFSVAIPREPVWSDAMLDMCTYGLASAGRGVDRDETA